MNALYKKRNYFDKKCPISTNLNDELLFSNILFQARKKRKNKRNYFTMAYNSNISSKAKIKNNLEININLSKEYKNFGGTFLLPDYNFASGNQILKDLQKKGVEKTLNKHFLREKENLHFINNLKPNMQVKTKKNNKSKYYNLISSNLNKRDKFYSKLSKHNVNDNKYCKIPQPNINDNRKKFFSLNKNNFQLTKRRNNSISIRDVSNSQQQKNTSYRSISAKFKNIYKIIYL